MSTGIVSDTEKPNYSSIFERLPDELLEAIFERSFSTIELKCLCLVNKRFNAIATKLLWREPKLRDFTLEDIKWISNLPVQVLDISGLISSRMPDSVYLEDFDF